MVDGNHRSTRRGLLLAGGLAMGGLAGCSAVRHRIDPADPALAFDPEALTDLADRPVPTPPGSYPVDIPQAWADHHRDRANALLAAVPTDLSLPNEALAEAIREDRVAIADAIAEADSTPHDSEFARLDAWRSHRRRAADIYGTYRAATGDFDAESASSRRNALRAEYFDFLSSWAYRSPDPVTAIVGHGRIERLTDDVRTGVTAWPAVPPDPLDAAFQAGDVMSSLERGRAALDDAVRIRERLLDRSTATGPHRDALTAAAHRLARDVRHARHRRDDWIDGDSPPVERDVEDTPAEWLFRRVQHRADESHQTITRDLEREHYASAIRRAGTSLVTLELLDEIVTRIEAGEYGTPSSAAEIRAERSAAVATLQHAWTQEPRRLSQELSWPATEALENAEYRLQQNDLERRDVNRIYASYARARHYAALVPAATRYVATILEHPS